MRPILIIIILLLAAMLIETAAADDIEWTKTYEYKLYEGDRFSKEGFRVEASNFYVDNGLVLLTIYHDEEIVASDILTGEEWINYNDEINVTVVNVTGYKRVWTGEKDNPRAEIEVRMRARPKLELSISTDKDEYDTDDNEIHVEVVLKNKGTICIEDVKLNIETNTIQSSGNLIYNYKNIPRHRSETVDIYLKTPHQKEKSTYEIRATVSGTSWDKEKITANTSRSISVLPCWKMLEIEKNLTGSVYLYADHINNSNNSFISIDPCIYVTLKVSNPGLMDINNIVLSDYLPENFILEDNSNLKWNFNLSSKKKKEFSYSMKPLSYGTYSIPPATTNWSLDEKKYNATSNQSQITVHAAYINLTKTLDRTNIAPGDEVTVSVNIHNTGNIQATVNVSDTLPENAVLLDRGTTSLKGVVLQKDGSQRFIYRIKINSTGDILLPPAKAEYTDIFGYKNTTTSNIVAIHTESGFFLKLFNRISYYI